MVKPPHLNRVSYISGIVPMTAYAKPPLCVTVPQTTITPEAGEGPTSSSPQRDFRTCTNRSLHLPFRQISLLTVLQTLANREIACGFAPCQP